jgi:hypothetical protein
VRQITIRSGLVLEIFYTQGAGETQQAVISGSADIGTGVGTFNTFGAFAKGAPIRVIAATHTGANDLTWYVKADSPIKDKKDLAGKSVAYSTTGSSTYGAVQAFQKEFGVTYKPVATGSPASTLTQVMRSTSVGRHRRLRSFVFCGCSTNLQAAKRSASALHSSRASSQQPVPIATFQVPGLDLDGSPQPPMSGCHQPSERLRGTVIPFAWFAQGLRLVDIADPFAPREVGHFLPDPPDRGRPRVLQRRDHRRSRTDLSR